MSGPLCGQHSCFTPQCVFYLNVYNAHIEYLCIVNACIKLSRLTFIMFVYNNVLHC